MNIKKNVFFFFALLLLTHCGAGNFSSLPLSQTSSTPSLAELKNQAATKKPFVKIIFHHNFFYSLTNPNSNRCAGDAKQVFDPFTLNGSQPTAFPASFLNTKESTKPAFLKNISVDLTDTQSSSTANLARSCALSTSPASLCATFDSASLQGTSATLSGSLLIFGGLSTPNPANQSTLPSLACGSLVSQTQATQSGSTQNIATCQSQTYTLSIDTLPSSTATDPPNALAPGLTQATEPISNWNQIKSTSSTTPPPLAGASFVMEPHLKKVLLFGGNATLSPSESFSFGADQNIAWLFDLPSQTWKKLSLQISTPISVGYMAVKTPKTLAYLSKTTPPRALFNYIAVPWSHFKTLSSTSTLDASLINKTDRIWIFSGILGFDPNTGKAVPSTSVHTLNPTFSPSWINLNDENLSAPFPSQWLDSSATAVLNETTEGRYKVKIGSATNPVEVFDQGSTSAIKDLGGGKYIGYAMSAGGFRADSAVTNATVNTGSLTYSRRKSATPTKFSSFLAIPTYALKSFSFFTSLGKSLGDLLAPIGYATDANPTQSLITEDGANQDRQVPYFGGGTLLQGFDLSKNDLVYFGGNNCIDYRIFTTDNQCPANRAQTSKWNTNTRYWRLQSNLETTLATTGNANSYTVLGTSPAFSGMAATRGLDSNGNPILVAWGGAGDDGTGKFGNAFKNSIYVLYNAGTLASPTPTWVEISMDTQTTKPPPAINAAMVYSHVTHKFYVFGGIYSSTQTISKDTWELSVQGTASGSTQNLAFSWKKLNTLGGLTCTPNCPQARYAHRMIEVNYFHLDPTSEYDSCPQNQPCSFAIFMEGGLNASKGVLSERWIFDPTASSGNGQWIRIDPFPPRHFAAMTTVSYYVPSLRKTLHKAILFGGETGLQNPLQASSGNYYVPPTLGDTYFYNFDQNTWEKVELFGIGIHTYDAATDPQNAFLKRQSFCSTATCAGGTYFHAELQALTPPPLSGAVMVTRNFAQALLESGSQTKALSIPEVFLLGGRKKDGSYLPLSKIYKFCIASSGESLTGDGTCESYHASTNPDSPFPVASSSGRWLLKTPQGIGSLDPSQVFSYLGASAYDPLHDKIIILGGLKPKAGKTKITEDRETSFDLYEYTPASQSMLPTTNPTTMDKNKVFGTLAKIPICTSSPTPQGRYAHTLAFDTLSGQLIAVGGFNSQGQPLTQTWMANGSPTAYHIPEIWAGKRTQDALGNPCYQWRQIQTFSNLLDPQNPQMPLTGLAHSAAVYFPSEGYNTGYYSVFDNQCADQGPIASPDSSVSKLLAGGVDIDLDRSQLNSNENLLLNLTYLPMSTQNFRPDKQKFSVDEKAIFKIHLIKNPLTLGELQSVFQPRFLTFSDEQRFPKIVDTLTVMIPNSGTIAQTQVLLPISIDSNINRIRIERHSGSGILIDASIFRLQPPVQ